MAGQLRAVKRRIGSVKSTQKITRAMELIASSRIIKAQRAVESARPYSEEMRRLMASVATNAGSIDSPLLKERDEIRRVGYAIISADRGLAGAYNSNVIRAAERDMREYGKDTKLYLVGKKAVSYFRFRGHDTSDNWQGISDRPSIADARKVAAKLAEDFLKGEVDEVRLAFTKYESAMTQKPVVIRLLPMDQSLVSDEAEGSEGPRASYLFEPEPESILDLLLPRYVEGTILQGLLEASASEHAARRRAMKAATDNADELIENLNRVYNQARQAEITTEIMEVIGGAEALSGN
ncbi:MAG: F0F1 ATP synthase subunit gamma [Actinomycetota bacterium]